MEQKLELFVHRSKTVTSLLRIEKSVNTRLMLLI